MFLLILPYFIVIASQGLKPQTTSIFSISQAKISQAQRILYYCIKSRPEVFERDEEDTETTSTLRSQSITN